MKVPNVFFKTISYVATGVVLLGLSGLASADEHTEESANKLRTEVKAALAPSDYDASPAAKSVADAVAAEILATGLKTEVLKQGLDADSPSSKVVALKTGADTPSGQADQT